MKIIGLFTGFIALSGQAQNLYLITLKLPKNEP